MKRFLLACFITTLIFSISTVTAQEKIDVILSQKSLMVYSSETQSIDVTIKNNQDKTATFALSVFPSQFEKVSTSLESFLITLGPNSEKTVKLYFTVAIDADLISPTFSITAKSTSDETITDTENVILMIQRKTPVYIQDIALEKYTLYPEEEMKISTKVFNLEDTKSGEYFLKIIVRKGATTIKTFEETIDAISSKSALVVSKSFVLDKYALPGSYIAEAELRDVQNSLKSFKSTSFNVNIVTSPPTEYVKISSGYNILFSTTTIKVKNEGNVELPSFTITRSVPKPMQNLFDPDIEPVSMESTQNRVIYTWYIPSLAPSEQYTIGYTFAIWRAWITIGIAAGIAYVAYKFLSTPRVTKGFKHEGEIVRGKEILILIEVKNNAFHEIKDVEVIDIVPPIAKVVEKFDTLRPKVTKVPNGAKLVWVFDSMKSREERVLTYRIRPVVDIVGTLNLPEAQMMFVDRRKVKKSVASKQALVKAG